MLDLLRRFSPLLLGLAGLILIGAALSFRLLQYFFWQTLEKSLGIAKTERSLSDSLRHSGVPLATVVSIAALRAMHSAMHSARLFVEWFGNVGENK
jgi:hypothetical protein